MEARPSTPSHTLQIVVRLAPERVCVVPHGDLDVATVVQLEAEIEQLRAGNATMIVLDLRQLTFIDSSGLRLLLRLDAASRADGFTFSILDGDGPARRLLDLTQMRDRFRHAED